MADCCKFKRRNKTFLTLLAIAAIPAIPALINRSICDSKFSKLEAPGDMIEIRPGEYIHAVSLGEGKYTVVMFSGLGTPCPYADFYELAEKLSGFCRVIIPELPGYGFSSLTDAPRTYENYDMEITAVLDYYGVKENVILMPHSYSGLFTFDYAKKHRDVVCGLLNEDASVWPQVKLFSQSKLTPEAIKSKLMEIGAKYYGALFMNKMIGKFFPDSSDPYTHIVHEMAYVRVGNKTVSAESDALKTMCDNLLGQKYDEDLPVLNMVALNENSAKMDERFLNEAGMTWPQMHEALVSNEAIQKMVRVKGAQHYIHHGHTDEIVKLAGWFIEDLERGEFRDTKEI